MESDAQKKASERQARLLAKSAERLAKITGAASGEGRVFSESAIGVSPARPTAPVVAASTPASVASKKKGKGTKANVAATLVPTSIGSIDDDPAEVDLAQERSRLPATLTPQQQMLQSMMAGGGGGAGSGAFANMMGAAGGDGAAAGGGDFMSQMMAQMASAGGAGGAMPGMGGADGIASPFTAPVSPFPPTPKTFIDRIFPLIHLLAMVGLAVYTIGWMEPSRRIGMLGSASATTGVNWSAWASLGHTRPATGLKGMMANVAGLGLAEIPLFYLFITVELVLQTTRLFLVRNRAPPPSLISSVLPILQGFSPQLALILKTSLHYVALLSLCLNDLAVLLFCIGIAIVYGKYVTGGEEGGLANQVIDIVGDTIEKIRVEL